MQKGRRDTELCSLTVPVLMCRRNTWSSERAFTQEGKRSACEARCVYHPVCLGRRSLGSVV